MGREWEGGTIQGWEKNKGGTKQGWEENKGWDKPGMGGE